MTCGTCEGACEVVVNRTGDPQNDESKTCPSCYGDGLHRCDGTGNCCDEVATVECWGRETPQSEQAAVCRYCAECYAAEMAAGRVLIDGEAALRAILAECTSWQKPPAESIEAIATIAAKALGAP